MSILVYLKDLKDLEYSRPAVEFAGLFARLMQTTVTLLQIVEPKDTKKSVDSAFERAEALLPGITTARRTRTGDPSIQILEEIRAGQYTMVAVRGRRAIRYRARLGKKVARNIALASTAPVLIVKENDEHPTLRRILVCTGGKDPSNPVIRKSVEVAQASGAEVTLLHIISPVPSMYTGMNEIEETFEELLQTDTPTARHLRRAAELLAEKDINARLEIRQGDVVEEILAECEAGDYDLIIIGAPSGDNRLKEWLMGDVTRGLVNLAGPAVLIVR